MKRGFVQAIGLAFIGGALVLLGILLVGIMDNNTLIRPRQIITNLIIMACAALIGARVYVSTVKDVSKRYPFMKVAMSILFLGYVLALVITMFTSRSLPEGMVLGSEGQSRSTNLIPFATIGNYFRLYGEGRLNLSIVIENLLGNLILFMPLGFFAPILIEKLKNTRNLLLTMFLLITSLEVIQYLLYAGAFDVDDIILNMLGSCLAYLLYRLSFIQWMLKKLYIVRANI